MSFLKNINVAKLKGYTKNDLVKLRLKYMNNINFAFFNVNKTLKLNLCRHLTRQINLPKEIKSDRIVIVNR